MKLSYLDGSVDQKKKKKHIFPHDLLVANILETAPPELFGFTNHAVKYRKITN